MRHPTLSQRAARWCALHGNLFGVIPVIVYQMAKVGSSSVVAALQDAGLPVFHVHRMDAARLERLREQRRALGWSVIPPPPHDLLGLRLRRTLLDRGGRAKLITVVREPIARNFSSYFEHLDAIWHTRDAHATLAAETLAQGFVERFLHDEPLTWFDDELHAATGIDVYAEPFPPEGHATIRTDRFDLLILKSELADDAKRAALETFTGRAPLPLRRMNQTADKTKGAAYREFVKRVRLDAAYVDRMLESRYVRHFYSDEERVRFRRAYDITPPDTSRAAR